jgi:hypothetical protein
VILGRGKVRRRAVGWPGKRGRREVGGRAAANRQMKSQDGIVKKVWGAGSVPGVALSSGVEWWPEVEKLVVGLPSVVGPGGAVRGPRDRPHRTSFAGRRF